MGTPISRRMDDSDSQSRSDDSSDQEYALTTILQYLMRRLVWGMTFQTMMCSCSFIKTGSTAVYNFWLATVRYEPVLLVISDIAMLSSALNITYLGWNDMYFTCCYVFVVMKVPIALNWAVVRVILWMINRNLAWSLQILVSQRELNRKHGACIVEIAACW